jgi:hypothetical protein
MQTLVFKDDLGWWFTRTTQGQDLRRRIEAKVKTVFVLDGDQATLVERYWQIRGGCEVHESVVLSL